MFFCIFFEEKPFTIAFKSISENSLSDFGKKYTSEKRCVLFAKKSFASATQPFEIREVLARVQVQLRRKEEKETGIECDLSFKDMVLNRDTFQVRIDGRILSKITKQEFAILELLLRNPKQVFSKEDIFEYAWDEPYMGETKTLDVHISNIRKKIKQVTSDEYIETVWGIGYRLHA